jgi:hypothetical protein
MEVIISFTIPSVKRTRFVNTLCFHSLVYFVKRAAKYSRSICMIITSFLQTYCGHYRKKETALIC